MKRLGILVLGLAVVAFAYASTEKDSLDSELAAALEAFIYSRGVDAGYLKRGSDDGLGDDGGVDDSLADALDSLAGDDSDDSDDDDDRRRLLTAFGDLKRGSDDGLGDDGMDDSFADALDSVDGVETESSDDDDDRRALLTAFGELDLHSRENNALTDDEEALVSDLAKLDDDTIQDLLDNRELLADDSDVSSRSVKAQVAEDLLISRLMNDHPDLRALAYGDEDTDSEDGAVLDRRGWFKKAWKKVKKFFKKVGSVLKKLWNKWKNKVIPWLVKKGKAIACSYCKSPRPTSGMGWAVFRIIKNLIKSAACAICKTG